MTSVLFVRVELEVGPLLPQEPHVVRQHADGERDDERDQESDDFATTTQRVVLRERRRRAVRGGRCRVEFSTTERRPFVDDAVADRFSAGLGHHDLDGGRLRRRRCGPAHGTVRVRRRPRLRRLGAGRRRQARRVAEAPTTSGSRPPRLHRETAGGGIHRLGAGLPQFDRDPGVDERHQRQRGDVKRDEVDEDVDTGDDWPRVEAEHVSIDDGGGSRGGTGVVRGRTLHVDGVVGDEVRKRVQDADRPDSGRYRSANSARPGEASV